MDTAFKVCPQLPHKNRKAAENVTSQRLLAHWLLALDISVLAFYSLCNKRILHRSFQLQQAFHKRTVYLCSVFPYYTPVFLFCQYFSYNLPLHNSFNYTLVFFCVFGCGFFQHMMWFHALCPMPFAFAVLIAPRRLPALAVRSINTST